MTGCARPRLKIAYLTSNDPKDRRSWSGTHYYIAQALQKHCGDVTFLGPISPLSATLGKICSRVLGKLTGKTYLYTHTIGLSKEIARIAERRMVGKEFDLVFAPAGSTQIAHLETRVPIVYLSDSTIDLVANYHAEFRNVLRSSLNAADHIERLAIHKASLILYASSWAARSAIEHYGAEESKVRVVPFGANMDEYPSRSAALKGSHTQECRLLFVGIDWVEKGGGIAFDTLLSLERRGIPARLTIVGCTPPKRFSHKALKVFPFLNKNRPGERQVMSELFRDADFFVLPTRAECYGIALCEANAYGLPVLATDTGGVCEIVRHGENGYLFPAAARGSDYAELISHLFSQTAKYMELRKNARANFECRLNWDVWGATVSTLLSGLT